MWHKNIIECCSMWTALIHHSPAAFGYILISSASSASRTFRPTMSDLLRSVWKFGCYNLLPRRNGNIIYVCISVFFFFFFSDNVVWFTSVFQRIIGILKILLFSSGISGKSKIFLQVLKFICCYILGFAGGSDG